MTTKKSQVNFRVHPILKELENALFKSTDEEKNRFFEKLYEQAIYQKIRDLCSDNHQGISDDLTDACNKFLEYQREKRKEEERREEPLVKWLSEKYEIVHKERELELSQAHKLREIIDELRGIEGEISMGKLRGVVLTPDYQNGITIDDVRMIGDTCIHGINPLERSAIRFDTVYNKLIDLFTSKNIDQDKLKEDFARALILVSYYDIIKGRVEYQTNREKGAITC